jgi:hypothetical protein
MEELIELARITFAVIVVMWVMFFFVSVVIFLGFILPWALIQMVIHALF